MKVFINLLPPEIVASELKKAKFYKVQFIAIGVILFMIFISSLTLALRVLQSHNNSLYKTKIAQAEQKISDMGKTQNSLLVLKDRLGMISQHYKIQSQQSKMYELLDTLVPSSVTVNAISIDKKGTVNLTVLTSDPAVLDQMIDNLTNKEKNQQAISQTGVDGVSRSASGLYRVSFTIKQKQDK